MNPFRRDEEKPDVQRARDQLDRVRRQRPDVEQLAAALRRERLLNNFTANIEATFRGRR